MIFVDHILILSRKKANLIGPNKLHKFKENFYFRERKPQPNCCMYFASPIFIHYKEMYKFYQIDIGNKFFIYVI